MNDDIATQDPSPVARVAASLVIGTVAGFVISKLIGRKAGITALFITIAAHEVADAPLAQFFTELGL
jgi:hypothetical protein